MIEAQLRIPIVLLMFGAAVWTFLLAHQRPQSLIQAPRKRAWSVMIEGLGCLGVWAGIEVFIGGTVVWAALANGAIAGFVWAAITYYSRSRYHILFTERLAGQPTERAG